MNSADDKLQLYYFRVTDLWKRFCELHSKLFDITCEEYSALLDNHIDKLDELLPQKDEILNQINNVELARQEVIAQINEEEIFDRNIYRVGDLVSFLADYERNNNLNLFEKMNDLLISIIEKIQEQNKMNQLFLNKAILSLREMKGDLSGEKVYSVYNAKGATKTEIR